MLPGPDRRPKVMLIRAFIVNILITLTFDPLDSEHCPTYGNER